MGPNGSGKSNIADAVQWVLGEQSAKNLRGAKMGDVIFTGGEKASPLNFAEVSLELENQGDLDLPYDLVKVSRRIYRDGENEYKLNGKKVRLKDIRELFLDTGIGKDGYSVIGQGRIDEIINSSPKDRRAIFEEASGISKYKYRRDESQKKLDKVKDNLDLIQRDRDYKKRELGELEVYAENFKKNQALTEELNKKAIFYLEGKTSSLNEKLSKSQKVLDDLNDKKACAKADLDKLNYQNLPLMTGIDDLTEKISQGEGRVTSLKRNVDKTQSDLSLLDQDLSYNKKDLERTEREVEGKSQREETLKNELIEAEKNLKANEDDLKSLLQEQKATEEALAFEKAEREEINKSLAKLRPERKALAKEIYDLDLEQKTRDRLEEEKKARRLEAQKRLEGLSQDIKIAREDYDKKKSALGKLSEDLANLRETQDGEGKKQADLLADLDKVKSLQNANLISLKEELSSYKIQKRLRESNEGYAYSVQEFLNKAPRDLYLDTLANLIGVKKGYEEVIDTLLGPALQNIVTRTKKDGGDLIKFVNREKLGRLTFLPIDSIRGYKKERPASPEVLAMAYELLDFDPSLSQIIYHFLGSTVLVKDIDSAISLSNKYQGYRIITLDLDIINTWGSMVGGRTKRGGKNLTLLNRDEKLKTSKEKILTLKKEEADLKENEETLQKTLASLKKDLESLEAKIKEKSEAEISGKIDLEKASYRLEGLRKEEDDLKASLEEVGGGEDLSSYADLKEKEELLDKEIGDLEASLKEKEEGISSLEKDLLKKSSAIEMAQRDRNLFSNKVEGAKVDLANLKEDLRQQARVVASLEEKVKTLEEDLAGKNKAGQKAGEDLKREEEALDDLREELKNKSSENSSLLQKIEARQAEISDLDLKIVKEGYNLDTIKRQEETIFDEVSPFLTGDMEELREKFKEEKREEVKKADLLALQKSLNQIGYFDEKSLETFTQAKEDFDFLDRQKKDLEASGKDLEKLIQKLEVTMKEEFAQNFEQINQNFQKIFKVLFLGGEAKLSLDGEDKLTAGVEIYASPPGKSRKNISLLSGGEKALTAVALLFAIFELNPAPFSILDEIDAALDESNIKRYIDYLRTLSDKTQFIIITHRQTTMKLAEEIHGVTIEDDGISKVYSLDFEK